MVSRIANLFRRKPRDEHHQVREMSSDFIDGEFDSKSSEDVRSHLERCGPCMAFVSTMRATVELLRSAARQQAPDSLREKIHEAVRDEENR